MRAYIIRRVLLMILTMFLVSLIIFFMIRLIPGSIVDMIIQNVALVTPATRHAVEHELGLDVPAHVQYVRWMGNIIIHGDLGNSLWTKAPVIEEIAARWPVTLELGLLGFIVAQLIALPVGVYSALRQDTWGDYIGRSFAIMCIAVPAFWLATMVIVFPSIWWGYMPPIMLIPFIEDPIGNLQMFIMPSVIAGMFMSGMAMRMTRTMMLEVLRRDYIRTAWAKGLRERVVILRHALKNALIPVITIVGLQVPGLIGGTVIIEQIFCLPGMGRLIVEATAVRDYTMISGVLLVFGTVMVVTNLMVDLTYAYLDPRVHYR
jgi:peptide/nickel transport system permease protein